MIEIKKFGKLRLRKLLENRKLFKAWNTEYLGRTWLGEEYIFSHALRLYSKPFTTKSLAIELEAINISEINRISLALEIDLSAMNSKNDCDNLFGEPIATKVYMDDRKTYVYFTAGKEYEVTFTIYNKGGLVYFTMATMDVAYYRDLLEN